MARARSSTFKTTLLRRADAAGGGARAFLVLPKSASDILPRRGRTSVEGTINGQPFKATLEPDGQLGHWFAVDEELRVAAGAEFEDTVTVRISPAQPEPEPALPRDLRQALDAAPAAKAVWKNTTTLARVDWIHWIESAKQAKTRERRVENACDMLASGKKRVCCFDPSGYYSKSLSAPQARAAKPGNTRDGTGGGTGDGKPSGKHDDAGSGKPGGKHGDTASGKRNGKSSGTPMLSGSCETSG
jgi:hypothetical protein